MWNKIWGGHGRFAHDVPADVYARPPDKLYRTFAEAVATFLLAWAGETP